MKRILLLFALLLAPVLYAQQTAPAMVTGTINAQASSCSLSLGSAACVFLQLNPSIAQASITVNGTFSATLQFEWSPDGGTTWVSLSSTPNGGGSAVTSTTSTGVWVANTGGASIMRVRGSSYSSGVATVTLNPSQAAAASTSSSSGIGVSSLTGDSTLFNNSASTGPVTLSPANQAANTVFGNPTGSAAPGASAQLVNGQIANGTIDLTTKVTGALPVANGGTGAATAGANTVFGNPTGSSAAGGFTSAPVVSSLGLAGATSGSATLTPPAVAGTATNPVASSNAMTFPAGTNCAGAMILGSPGGATSGIIFNSTAEVSLCDGGSTIFQGSGTHALLGAVVGLVGINRMLISSTAPTIAAGGCGGSAASIVTSNGTAAFKVNVGTSPGSACTLTMPAATTGWNCTANDITTVSTSVFLQKQTGAESTTSVVITNYSDVAAATAFTASDILKVTCTAD